MICDDALHEMMLCWHKLAPAPGVGGWQQVEGVQQPLNLPVSEKCRDKLVCAPGVRGWEQVEGVQQPLKLAVSGECIGNTCAAQKEGSGW